MALPKHESKLKGRMNPGWMGDYRGPQRSWWFVIIRRGSCPIKSSKYFDHITGPTKSQVQNRHNKLKKYASKKSANQWHKHRESEVAG
jgi:hypothetical protein